MNLQRSVLVVVFATGCAFDTGSGGGGGQLGSAGGDTGTTVPDDGPGSGSGAPTTSAAATSSVTTTAMPTDGGAAATGSDNTGTTAVAGVTTDEGSTTTPVDPCVSPPTVMIDLGVADGTVTAPMQVNGDVAYSEVADMGAIAFSFDVDCPDEYAIWGHVYDGVPGVLEFIPGDAADAYHVEVDGMPIAWAYGCDTLVSQWSWQAVSTHAPDCSDDNLVVFDLAAGQHTLLVRNVEPGQAFTLPPTAAMIETVIITNDLDYHP